MGGSDAGIASEGAGERWTGEVHGWGERWRGFGVDGFIDCEWSWECGGTVVETGT